MNYIGLAFALIATFAFFFVDPAENSEQSDDEDKAEKQKKEAGREDELFTKAEKPRCKSSLPADHYVKLAGDEIAGRSTTDPGRAMHKLPAPKKRQGMKKVPSWETFSGVHVHHQGESARSSMRERVEKVDEEIADPVEKFEEIQEVVAAASWIDLLPSNVRRVSGASMAVLAGLFFGTNMTFVTHEYNINHPDRNGDPYSSNGLDYVYSHFTGVLLSSLFYWVVYCIVMRNRPKINPKVALPGWVSGLMWGSAQSCWFVANDKLGYTTAYPIIAVGPGVIAACWGIFVFKEISGLKNLTIFSFAVVTFACACLLIAIGHG